MKTIIVGPRDYRDDFTVCDAVRNSGFDVTEVLGGCAAGEDELGERWAQAHNVPVKKIPARGEASELFRNGEIAQYADSLVAIWNGEAQGTGAMIRQARATGLEVYVYMIGPESRCEQI